MLKKVIIAVGVVFVLMLLVFGWDKSWSYVEGTQQVLNEEADNRTPMKLERARIASLLQKEHESVGTYEDRIGELEARRDGAARALGDGYKKLALEMDLLTKIKAMLDEKRDTYTIGRSTYTFAEVNADALERVEAVKQMREDFAFQQSLVDDLDRAIKQGRGSLAEAHKRLAELTHAMTRLEARNANADVRLQVAQLTNAIAGAPFSSGSELESAVANYERRIGQKERQAYARLSVSNAQFRIDYAAALVTQDASSEISQVLEDVQKHTSATEAPQERRSALDALEDDQN